MRKLIVLSYITLDGVMQAPGGSKEDTREGFKYGGWMGPFFDDFSGKIMEEQMAPPFSLVLGKTTYNIFAEYWPHHEDGWPGVNAATKYVASHNHLLKLEWRNSVLLTGDVVKELETLKLQEGPELQVWGSGNLSQTLFKHALVDELRLKIFPITLGTGKRLFAEGTIPAAFKVSWSQVSPTGVIFANLERTGEVQTSTFGE
jgi:dihydrofolate reductase